MARLFCIALLLGSCAAQNDDEDPSGSDSGSGSGDEDSISPTDTMATPFFATAYSVGTPTAQPNGTGPTATPTATGGDGCPDAPDTGFAVLDPDVQLDADHPPHRNATCAELKLHGGCDHPAHGERIRERCASSCGVSPTACWTAPTMSTVDDADAGPTGLGFFEALADDEIVWVAVVASLGLGSLVATVLVVRAKRRDRG